MSLGNTESGDLAASEPPPRLSTLGFNSSDRFRIKSKMELPLYQVDSFTSRVFGGNPACIVVLPRCFDAWPDTELLANIAKENYVAETAFLLRFRLSWI